MTSAPTMDPIHPGEILMLDYLVSTEPEVEVISPRAKVAGVVG